MHAGVAIESHQCLENSPNSRFPFSPPTAITSMTSPILLDSTPPPIDYEIITVPSIGHADREELFKQCLDLRMDVFHVEQGFPAETELDE